MARVRSGTGKFSNCEAAHMPARRRGTTFAGNRALATRRTGSGCDGEEDAVKMDRAGRGTAGVRHGGLRASADAEANCDCRVVAVLAGAAAVVDRATRPGSRGQPTDAA